MKTEKRKAIPPLGTHSPSFKLTEKRIRGPLNTSSKRESPTMDAEYLGTQTPFAKYDCARADKITQNKTLFVKMYEKRYDPNEHKLKKTDDPDGGTYDPDKAFFGTQVHSIDRRGCKIFPPTNGPKRKTFIDDSPKPTKFVPGPGHYLSPERGYNAISSSPKSIRVKRH